ncbi:hypothetical protein [Roseimicrobium sp. ORNL1]|uniref:hypothetical protein n=1 Tax=Roseimicrobium sp. ORNL1 TaxID=2711231 RepID=UPI0013E198D8|nr:hypothetical protein [Roseimicrobium sp. ORNL1]QIF03118.1 hypothetical protein G5S37_16850 [Roseimicrobium sp. ORNL1]
MKRALNLRNTVKSGTSLGMVASLLASLAWSMLPTTTFAEETKVLADQEFYTKGSFIPTRDHGPRTLAPASPSNTASTSPTRSR